MTEESIKSIFSKVNIKTKDIKRATNSFNSNVYIVLSDNNKKYILKFYKNENKMVCESEYMIYLKNYLLVADIITTGIFNGKYYTIQTFLEGENLFDEKANELNKIQINNIGVLLAKLHSVRTIDSDNWVNYLNECVDKTVDDLENVFGKKNNNIIYNYIKKYINDKVKNNYKSSVLHMDFRIGNLIFKKCNNVGLIDLESMKTGDYVFDFVKLNRILSEDNFNILLNDYKNIKEIDNNFYEKLDFYSLFDSYTSLWWCINKNQIDTDFYKLNYDIVINYLNKMID